MFGESSLSVVETRVRCFSKSADLIAFSFSFGLRCQGGEGECEISCTLAASSSEFLIIDFFFIWGGERWVMFIQLSEICFPTPFSLAELLWCKQTDNLPPGFLAGSAEPGDGDISRGCAFQRSSPYLSYNVLIVETGWLAGLAVLLRL